MAHEISDLIARWHNQQREGQPLSLAELCADCPEQLPALQRHLEAVKAMEAFLGLHSGVPTSPADTVEQGTEQAPKPTSDATFPDLPGYEILDELGRGGMGVVYKARHRKLNQVVALKMILAGRHAAPKDHTRFLTEAEATAGLRHPHIVSLLEFGECGGLPFFTMEFVPGGSLASRLNGVPLPPRQAARLIEQLARGIHHAHSQNIIHRDLKPENVLLAEDGTPKITDFGLARRVEVGAGLTVSGAVMGTPSYMAPEQARGETRHAGPTADVYGLGAILYECLTGRPPFKAATPVDTILQVLDLEAVSVRQLQPQTNIDLATICHKCLEKDPHRRYATALELAEDLRRFQAGEPIRGRPISLGERALKWVRRRPTLAAAYGLLGLALVLGGLGAGVAWLWRDADLARLEADNGRRREAELRQQLTHVSYLHRIGLAHREWQDGEIALTEELLESCPSEMRNWEWNYVSRLCHTDLLTLRGHTGEVNQVLYHPDGRWIFSSGVDGTIRAWNAQTGKAVFTLQAHTGSIRNIALSPNGKYLAWVNENQAVHLWEVASRKEITSFVGPFDLATGLAFSYDSRRLAAASEDSSLVQVWDIPSGRESLRLAWRISNRSSLAFSPDGRHLVVGCVGGLIRWCDLSTGQESPTRQKLPCEVDTIAFSSNGKLFAVKGVDQILSLWDTVTCQLRLTLWGNKDGLSSLVFSPDGSKIASGSNGHMIRVWDTASGKELLSLKGHRSGITGVSYSPDGRRMTSSSTDGTIKVWDATRVQEGFSVSPREGWIRNLAFSPDGKELASGHDQGTVHFWDAATGKSIRTIRTSSGRTFGVAYSPDGSFLATANKPVNSQQGPGEVKIWDVQSGKALLTLSNPPKRPYRVSFSPDGKHVACSGRDGKIQVWHAITGRVVATFPDGLSVRFSPDGQRVIGGLYQGMIKVWDLATGNELLSIKGHAERVADVASSLDGKLIASASYDQTVKVWNATMGDLVSTFQGHKARVLSVAFSPDSRRVFSSSDDQTIRVFITDTGEETIVLKGHAGPVHYLAISPDGGRIASGGWDETVRVWNGIPPTN